jgi:hypothetical protein
MLGKPVVRCLAKYNSLEAEKGPDEDAEGLQKEILLSEGEKNHDSLQRVDFNRCVKFILLLQFIHIDFIGLVNGCQGIVKKITSLDLICASTFHQLCLFSATDIQVFVDSLIIQGDCLNEFNRSSNTRSGGN